MEKISAACAMDWSIELEKALRSKRPGQPIDAISQMGPRLQRWSSEPVVTMAMSNMFGLVQGEDRLFANSILLRLADAFRFGDVPTRVCVLKVFLSEMRHRRKKGKQYNGILAKQRVPNYIELLKRVKFVFDTGDVESRALSLRLLGCWADIAKDSAEIRYMILSTMESCHILEVKASLFAAGCLCELSEDFACVVLVKLNNMINSSTTSFDAKLVAARAFSKMGCSSLIANRAYKIGKKLVLDSPQEEFVIQMLLSLSKLTLKSILLIPDQMDLLISFLRQESATLVSATALKGLHFLSVGGISRLPFDANVVSTLFHVIDNTDMPLNSQCEALKVLRKVFCYTLPLPNLDMHEFLELILIAESAAQSPTISKRYLALGLLVDISCNFKRKMGDKRYYSPELSSVTDVPQESLQDSVPASDGNKLTSLPWRVSLLVIDQITFLVQQVNVESCKGELMSMSKLKLCSFKVKDCQSLLNFVLCLVKDHPTLGLVSLKKVKILIESLVNARYALDNEAAGTHDDVSEMDVDTENPSSSLPKVTEVEGKMYASTVSELVVCLCKFTSACLEVLDESGAVSTEIYNIVKLLGECIQQSGLLNNMCVAVSLLLRSHCMWCCFGSDNFTISSPSSKLSHDDCWLQHEWVTLEFAKKMVTRADFWAVYKTGKYAASQGVWFAATFAFKILIKQAESDTCRSWLKSLALFAGAESEIQLLLYPRQGIRLIERLQNKSIQEKPCGDDVVEYVDLPEVKEKLVKAFSRICSAEEALAAVVSSNRPFCFQQWFWRLRAKTFETVADIFGLLISCPIAEENVNDDGQVLLQHMHSFAYHFAHCAFRLKRLAKEFDLLATSFMDIDSKSFQLISRLALNCSLLAFCTVFAIHFPEIPRHKNGIAYILEGWEKCSPAIVTQDLFERLWHIDHKTSTDLQLFSAGTGNQSEFLQSRTQISSCAYRERATLRVCQFAVSGVFKIQEEAKRVEGEGDLSQIIRAGLQLLSEILRKWLHIPFQTPKYFFRLRPCVGAELFAFNADTQNRGEISITSGFCLSLNLCIQLKNVSTACRIEDSKLYCILAINMSDCQPIGRRESMGQLQSGFQAWKTNVMVDLNEELLHHLKDGPSKTRKIHGDISDAGLVKSFVCFEPNERGQGFSTCLLDVSSLPEGSYQLTWHSCCTDRKGSCWSLVPLNTGPLLTVKKPHASVS
ncbi:hypothetical protein CKAN_01581500 [Cinnamomum micranthum f. kanehirae]|uniref:Integrator complex subunit 7 n=1 Tax=Cinnamomum micranthum f. kanehirae TaxID=337451 RepID=A0A443P7X5_9MAGN|nr:hypothetical protein CKAN_01581500 [Cinnamomum micranthum f. kanehirae]